MSVCSDRLEHRRKNLVRKSSMGEDLGYLDRRIAANIDDKESARDFLQSIEEFMGRKAHELAAGRKRLGLPTGLEKDHWPKSKLSQAAGKLRQAS